jgi:CRP-like cAMP-binding protein
MIDEAYTPLLNNLRRFIDLNEAEEARIANEVVSVNLKKKEFLLEAGKVCRDQFFVTNGCLKSYSLDQNGVAHITTFAIEGWWVGDMLSYTKETPSHYFLQALEETKVLALSKDNLEKLLIDIPKLEKFFRVLYQRSLSSFISRSNENISMTAEQKYEVFKTKYPKLEQRISQKNIASYIGVTPEFFSLLKRRLLKG